MKTALPLALALTAVAFTQGALAEPRRLELSATAGMRFGGSLDVGLDDESDIADDGLDEHGNLSLDSAASYGGILGFRAQKNGLAFLSYSRQETTARYHQFNDSGTETDTASVSIEYFQVGGNLEVTRGRLTPYFGLSIGATRFAGLDSDSGDYWAFSGAFDGGLKVELAPFLYLRVLGRLPITFPSGNVYCISSRGCVVALHGQALVQGEFQGGITLAL